MLTLRIWDLPTRLFHWLLALCLVGLVITGNVGGNAMVWHFRFGYVVFSLLLFRVLWGLMGGHWSRWSSLPLGFSSLRRYLQGRGQASDLAGHNPLGAWSVLAMLFFLSLQVGTGLISDDEIANMGPLSSSVSGAWVSAATHWHKHWGKLLLILLVLIHLLAIAWYSWRKRQALVQAMWHGDKVLQNPVLATVDSSRTRWIALALMALAATAVAFVVLPGS
ncbi:cytochrome b/b6 domain-containing protein [Limnohabitans sp.]|jgi:cytochrome b|uniref:cytochrome b/b6 domain-containing protein n=1 Tax=Limnohabitans sp. TaxID=1907725 RepID=UPI002630E1D1|nr:cytochrome b/b6 domain-containing protein [Limnohabitans sp.]